MSKFKLANNGHWMLTGANRFLLASSGMEGLTTALSFVNYVSFNKDPAVAAQPIIQRKAGLTTGDVPVLYTYTGPAPTQPQAQVVKAVGGAIVKDWTTLSSISVDGSGNGLGTLVGVPQGSDYIVKLRDGAQPANGATSSTGVQAFGVGVIVLYMGQSNMVNMYYSGDYGALVPGTSISEFDYIQTGQVKGAIFSDVGWHHPLGQVYSYNGSQSGGEVSGNIMGFLRIVSNNLKAKYGADVPVGMVPWGFNGTGIESFLPSTPGGRWSQLKDGSGIVANNIGGTLGFSSPKNYWAGDFEGVVWHQGEANQGDTPTQYRDKLIALYQGFLDYTAPFGRTAANLFFAPASLGRASDCPSIENIRKAGSDLEAYAAANAWPKVRIGFTCIDLTGDSLHMDGPGAIKAMRRSIQAVLYHLGCSTRSGRGPQISGVSRASLVATLSVTHDGGTALVLKTPGNPIKGFYANTAADFTGTDIAVTAALANSNTQIAVTFPGGTTFPCYLKYMGGRIGSSTFDSDGNIASSSPNITNPIYDNVTYPTGTIGTDTELLGLPLLPTFTALTVA